MTQTKQEKSLKLKSQTTVAQNIVIGSVAGATEVLVNHPLWSIKTGIQRGEAFSFNPTLWYRGILPNAASMIPITALQVVLNRGLLNIFFKDSALSNYQSIGCSFAAGIGSSLISCPTEMIMTHQNKGVSFTKHQWRCLINVVGDIYSLHYR